MNFIYWYFAIIYFSGIYFNVLYLIFCDSHRDGQKAFFDIVEEQISKRGPKNGLRSTPTTQKVWRQIQIIQILQIYKYI